MPVGSPYLIDVLLEEAGRSNVSAMTRSLADMCKRDQKFKHCDRDIFRFIRMPVVSWHAASIINSSRCSIP